MSLLGRHFTGLADFSGRENRQPFWLWILICYAIQTIGSMIVMFPLMMSMFDRMTPLMQGDPHRFDNHPELVFQMMAPMMSSMMIFAVIVGAVWLVLIAAAVVRRLHDSDRSGWWASPVFALHVVGPLLYLTAFPRFFEKATAIRNDMTPDQVNAVMMPAMQSFMWVWLVGMLGFVAMVVLIILLCQPGTAGPNRFGDDPLAVR